MQGSLSAERFSALVGQIYDCILAPEGWTETIEAIRHEFDFANAALSVHHFDGRSGYQALAKMDADDASAAMRLAVPLLELWGGAARIRQYPLGEPIVGSVLAGPEAMATNQYMREWCRPRGVWDAVTIGLARNAGMVGTLTFGQLERNGPIADAAIETLRLLAPHIRRAVMIGNVFEMRTVEAQAFEAILDSLTAGVLLVDESLSIKRCNAAAQGMLDEGDALCARFGRVELRSEVSQRALRATVRQALGEAGPLGERGVGLPVARRDGKSAIIHVMPLRHVQSAHGREPATPLVALLVTPTNAPPLPRDALALLYDLTPAEARVFEMLCGGHEKAAIAEQLGVKISTIKTHLQRVFDKTGTRRQVELVRLAATLALPV